MTPFKLIYLYINIKLSKNQICVVKITHGGGVAAPIVSQVLGEVLPYLEIEKKEEAGLNYKIEGETENDTIIEQLPKKGIEITEGTEIILYL